MPKIYLHLHDREWLRAKYEDEKLTVAEIAAEVGCAPTGVIVAMRRHGLQRRSPFASAVLRGSARGPKQAPLLADADRLRTLYVDEGRSLQDIADMVGVTPAGVHRAMTRHGIPRREPNGGRRSNEPVPQLHDADWLRRAYVDEHRSTKDIAAEVGASHLTVASALSRFGIRRREPLPADWQNEPQRRSKNNGGYVIVWAPDHPAQTGNGYVAEHRLIAERVLGRYLAPGEIVHHVNATRDDNREDNLMVFASYGLHCRFHQNPPAWIPRCECCGKPHFEAIAARPAHVPFYAATIADASGAT